MFGLTHLTLFALTVSALSIPTISSPPSNKQLSLHRPNKRLLLPTYPWTSLAALTLAQCLLHYSPPPSTCVFYTSASRPLAIQYALAHDLTTIYDVYPPIYFNTSHSPASTWKATGHLRDLFRITSKAYAIACSGEATLVLPEDAEPCPDSIWVTDEYDAIRSGLSRIELPVWRVSWSFDRVQGVWGWMKRVLSARTGREGEVGVGRRNVKRTAARGWKDVHAAFVQPESDDLRLKLEVMQQQWAWTELDDRGGDLWALAEGKCDRPQR